MTERYFFVVDTGQLRTYQETTAPETDESTLIPVMGLDLPASRVSGEKRGAMELQNGTRVGGQGTHASELEARFAAEINGFLLSRPAAHWALAVPPAMEAGVVAGMDAGVLRRMDTCLATRLSNLSPHEIYEHFGQASPGRTS